MIDYVQIYEHCPSFIFDRFFPTFLYFASFLSTLSFKHFFYYRTFTSHSIVFNKHLSPKYKTIKEQILTVDNLPMYSELIYPSSRQLKYLVNKQGYRIHRDDCSDMKIQNTLLFMSIFGAKKSLNVNTTSK